ncbi:MAG: Amuc_1102 family pilus-like protein [bacterium]
MLAVVQEEMYTFMKRLALAGLIVLSIAVSVPAQQLEGGKKQLSINKIEGKKVMTPEYQVSKSQFKARTREWFQIITTYETKPEWVDEVTFKYYVLVKDKGGEVGSRQSLFSGEVTYINVEKGKHKSDVYLHPSTISRFGEVQAVAVMVSVQGRVEAIESLPTSNERWWEKLTPVDGMLLNRMQTPFAMLYFDDYEAVKSAK